MGSMQNRRASTWHLLFGGALALGCASAWAQIPNAPPTPVCAWETAPGDKRSTCRFKPALAGSPTSLSGNRVILFRRAMQGGHGPSRTYSEDALKRLASKYGFNLLVSEDPTVFTPANLATTKVVIMSNGDGDVVPAGTNREALQNFQRQNGWGVIWIHAACAFITSAWPFGRESCVQQFYEHDPANTQRRVFVDSGTAANPNQGIKNPQTEFLMRDLPGYDNKRTLALTEEWYCFQAPARNTAGVNVLLGYDRSSGIPTDVACPSRSDASALGSQSHNLAWTRPMGQGIAIYNSIGHEAGTFTSNGNAGDSLLWRFIRYAAKDWCVSGTEGCGTTTVFRADTRPMADAVGKSGSLSLDFADAGQHDVTVSDVTGKRVFAKSYSGVHGAEIPDLRRGLYFVRVASRQGTEVRRVRLL